MRDLLREAERWVAQAEIDLEGAGMLAERLPALACFHAQQAAEKALKGILYAAGERAVLGHSVGQLGSRVREISPGYEQLHDELAKLDRFYIPTRYPNGLPEGGDPATAFDRDDAGSAMASAQRALEHARQYLSGRSPGRGTGGRQTEA